MKKNLKKLVSTVAALALSVSCFSAFAANFSDVADTASYKTAVDNLVALGIVNGYEDGTFGPEKEITRAEISKMIVSAMGPAYMSAAESSKGTEVFDDVAGDHWASGYIAQGASIGYINGFEDGTFKPEEKVTFAQTVKMLVVALGYDEDAQGAGGYPNGYVNVGSQIGVTDGVNVGADVAVNRGQVAQLINNALQTPINAIVKWETGLSMDEDGNIITVKVPVTEVYDGKGDSGKYETLLTTYFDAYAVRGRIMDTSEKGKGVVTYTIEYSENFDDEVGVYTGKKDKDGKLTTADIEAYYPAGTDVDALLCAYTDAIVMENEDGDWELISVVSYGKNEITELDSELYQAKDDSLKAPTASDAGYIRFFKNASTTKVDEYDLAAGAQLYVNGRNVTLNKTNIDKYVKDNATTSVKLVNTPAAGTKTIDSKYDYVMLSVYTSAVVDEIELDDDKAIIYLENNDYDLMNGSQIELDLEAIADGDQEYSLVDVDGNEVALDALKVNDVITVYADFANPASGSKIKKPDFIDMYVSTNVVEGKVTGSDTEDGEFTIGGTAYKFATQNKGTELKVGDEYTLYLDMFNKIVAHEVLASVVNYGIINKVAVNNNTEEYEMRLVNADGQVVTYEFKNDADYTTWKANYDAAKTTASAADKDFMDVYANMVVTYKLDSSDRIYDIKKIDSITSTTGEFSEKNAKVSSAKMSDATKIINFINGVKNWETGKNLSTYVSATSIGEFVDGETYTVLYGYSNDKFTDGTYPLVIVTKGVDKISTSTSFAVVTGSGSEINEADGIAYNAVYVLQNGEAKTLFFSGDAPSVKKGDVVVYGLDSDGLVDEAQGYWKVLFSAAASEGKLSYAKNYTFASKTGVYASPFYAEAAWTAWNYTTVQNEKFANVGYGVLVDKTASDIVLGKVKSGSYKWTPEGGSEETRTGLITDFATDVDELELADDVNVYVYDMNASSDERVVKGSTGSLAPTKLAGRYIDDSAAEDVYIWAESGKTAAKSVFFKTFEDEITDILVIIPEDK